jgi:molybdopterin-guanine dinucleotide biosynthesis protein A
MAGADKGLLPLKGRPLIAWVIDRLRPQVHELLISANRNRERYAALGASVVTDMTPEFAGPLAGLQAGLKAAAFPLVLMVPCDAPLLPGDLVQRLLQGLEQAGTRAAIVRAAGRLHPTFGLCQREVAADLDAYLAEGGRKLESWFQRVGAVEVSFDDEAQALANINTPADLEAVAARL